MNSSASFLVVAIGASAGGLPALEELFAAIASDERGAAAAYCVVQHLSPNFKSLMAQILERRTSLEIAVVEDGMAVEPGHLYLNRRDQHVVCEGGVFRLRPKEERAAVQFPIDLFFSSVAACFGERATAVVLSGTGSDGSRGVRAVKAAGGEVLVQAPETAQFDGMPNAALATDLVDGVGSPAQLAARLIAQIRGALGDEGDAEAGADERWPRSWQDAFGQLLRLLRAHSGIDFGHYKASTLIRRLDKHLALHGVTLPEYLKVVRERERERELLVRDFLIGVTSFFRDPQVFEALAREHLLALVDACGGDEELRIWVAGCSSGEEAYTYAILLSELFARRGEAPRFKILATDVDAQAIRAASEGRYPEAAVRGLGQATLEAHFTRGDDSYTVRKQLREKIVFSLHNLLSDPPFVRIDVVSMRNVLIYLRPAAQRDALTNVAFALRPGGLLVLGSSGAVNELSEPFEVVDARLRIFRRRPEVDVRWARHAHRLPLRAYDREQLRQRFRTGASASDELTRALLDLYAPPVVVVDDEFRVIHVHGNVGRLFELPPGPPSADLRLLMPGALGGVLSTSLRQARQRGGPVTIEAAPLEGSADVVDVTVRVLPGSPRRYAVELRRREADPERGEIRRFADVDVGRVAELERLLAGKQEELQSLVEELESANEELQSTNEELIAGNEELQSTNEELQSVNEELYTVNAELERRNSDLIALSNDVNNLLTTTDIATLLLDAELNIRRFTPAMREIFRLDPGDVGRNLRAFASDLDEPDERLIALAAEVLRGGEGHEDRIRDRRGRIYLRRLHPFVTDAGVIDGVVITLVDVSGLDAMRAEIDRHALQAAAAFDLLHGAFFEVLPAEGLLRLRGDVAALFPDAAGVTHEATIGDLLARVHPEDRARAAMVFTAAAVDAPPETREFRLRAASDRFIHVRARSRVAGGGDTLPWVTGVLLDVTEWVEKEGELVRSRARLDLLMSSLPSGIVSVLDEDLIFREVYGRELERLRLGVDDVVGRPLEDIYSAEAAARIRQECGRALAEGRQVTFENSFGAQTYLINAMPVPSGVAGRRQLLVLSTNITEVQAARDELRRAKEAAERANSSRLAFLAAMSHELRTPLAGMVGLLDLLDGDAVVDAARPRLRQLRGLVEAQERLIRDLLDLSRIDAGRLALENERFVVVHALEGVEASLRGGARPGVAIDVQLPAADATFVGDPLRIRQLVDNLTSNALKYTEAGAIALRVAIQGDGVLEIEVADSGCGIAAEELPRIFDVFTRGGDRRRAPGVGLGLTIVQRLVEEMGGTVAVQSQLGVGSTFTLRIPAAIDPAAPALEPADGRERALLAGRRVLLVEDNEMIRIVVGELLGRDGVEVVEAVDAADAERALAGAAFDAILMDIGLPDRSGLAVIRGIRAAEAGQGRRVPIIALTAYAYEEDVRRSLDAGADAHLTKPVGHAALRQALTRALRDADRRRPG